LERGQRQMSLPVLVKIATSLHVSLDYLIFGKNKIDNSCYYINEIPNENDKHYEIDLKTEIIELTNKCSYKEFRLINKIIKTILPYIRES
jgi:transcriptional regulator with XRE-family HTH domain